MKKQILYVLAASLPLLYMNPINAIGDPISPTSKKLGFGFEPGLIVGRDYVAGQLIVGIKKGVSTQNVVQAASTLGGRVAKQIEGTSLLLQFSSEAASEAAIAALIAPPDVQFVERNGFMGVPPTPRFPSLQKQTRLTA